MVHQSVKRLGTYAEDCLARAGEQRHNMMHSHRDVSLSVPDAGFPNIWNRHQQKPDAKGMVGVQVDEDSSAVPTVDLFAAILVTLVASFFSLLLVW